MTVAAERYLGLDFGTLSVRALLADARGRGRRRRRPPPTPAARSCGATGGAPGSPSRWPAGWALQDPDDWLAERRRRGARRRRWRRPPSTRDAVAGVGVDFTSCTVLPALADGTPLARTDLAARPHAWPKLWKHHGARGRRPSSPTWPAGAAEPWLDRYGGRRRAGVVVPEAARGGRRRSRRWPRPPRCGWRAATGWCGSSPARRRSAATATAAGLVRSTCQAGYKALWSPAAGYPGAAYLDAVPPGLRRRWPSGCSAAASGRPGEPAGRAVRGGRAGCSGCGPACRCRPR